VAIDGSNDGSPALLDDLQTSCGDRLRLLALPSNEGKGTALLSAISLAHEEDFSHALTMDSDGQHPPENIPDFMSLGAAHPTDLLMGQPIFGSDASLARVLGKELTLWMTGLETPGAKLGDTLLGMRLNPIRGFLEAFHQTRFARGFDFDPEIAVRMAWLGHTPRQVPVRVRYVSKDKGGVSHFYYLRDDIRLTAPHFRLLPECLFCRLIPFLARHSQGETI